MTPDDMAIAVHAKLRGVTMAYRDETIEHIAVACRVAFNAGLEAGELIAYGVWENEAHRGDKNAAGIADLIYTEIRRARLSQKEENTDG